MVRLVHQYSWPSIRNYKQKATLKVSIRKYFLSYLLQFYFQTSELRCLFDAFCLCLWTQLSLLLIPHLQPLEPNKLSLHCSTLKRDTTRAIKIFILRIWLQTNYFKETRRKDNQSWSENCFDRIFSFISSDWSCSKVSSEMPNWKDGVRVNFETWYLILCRSNFAAQVFTLPNCIRAVISQQ